MWLLNSRTELKFAFVLSQRMSAKYIEVVSVNYDDSMFLMADDDAQYRALLKQLCIQHMKSTH